MSYRSRSPSPRRSSRYSPERSRGRNRAIGSDKERRDTKTLFVGNLPYHYRERDLAGTLERCGPIRSVTIGINRRTGQSKGYAFVEFEDRRDAEDAFDRFNGHTLEGRRLRLDWDIGLMKKQDVYGYGSRDRNGGSLRDRDRYDRNRYDRDRYDRYDRYERDRRYSPRRDRRRSYSRSPPRNRRSPSPYHSSRDQGTAHSPRRGSHSPTSPHRSPHRSNSPRRSPHHSISPRRSPHRSISPRRSPHRSMSPHHGASPRRSVSPRPRSPPEERKRSRSPVGGRTPSPNDAKRSRAGSDI